MKKFILMLVAVFATMTASAQIATENSKFFDNWSIGVGAGVTTPLDFNSVFPVNTGAKLFINKDITPVFGLQAEGGILFNDNNFGRWTSTTVKLTNVGINGTINLNNLFDGYQGTPRVFEISTNTGLGWMHLWNSGGANYLTAKTGLDIAFNLGKTKAISVVLSPAIYWNLNANGNLAFNKNNAQLALSVGLVYHFKTSNGTRHFKTYDVGAMMGEISRLNDELAKKPNEVIVEKVVYKEDAPVTNAVATADAEIDPAATYVFFAFNSATLDEYAKAELDKVGQDGIYDVVAYASAGGSADYNKKLSEKRAAVVADYLTKRGCKINSFEGRGVEFGESTGRVAIVKPFRK